MAWEWLDTVEGLEGSIAEIGGLNTTWDYALANIGNPNTYGTQISYSSQYSNPPASISGGSGAFVYDFESALQSHTYNSGWGFDINYVYTTGTGANTSGNVSWSYDTKTSAQGGLNRKCGIRFAVDHDRQIAVMILAIYFYNGANYLSLWRMWSDWYNPDTGQRENTAPYLYTYLMEHQPPQYVWQSVPAISGKNGILSLPILIDTDGNPVSNGSASDFSTLPDSVKVRTLADLAVQ